MTEEEDNQGAQDGGASGGRVPETSARDAEVSERRRELEEELESYAQAGAYSPGLVKASRWVSRALYFLMAGALAFLIFSGWGKYSEREFQAIHEAQKQWQKKAETEEERREELQTQWTDAQIEIAELRHELRSMTSGRPAADGALEDARRLVDYYWGESQYAAKWMEVIERAEPEAHGNNPVAAAAELIEQAANSPAAMEIELLREVADFGRDAATVAVKAQLDSEDQDVARAAARVAGWLGGDEIEDWTRDAIRESEAPHVGFLYSLLTREAPPEGAGRHLPQAWVGYAMRGYDATHEELAKAYNDAPDRRKLALLALLAETAQDREDAAFRSVATSGRPVAERIVAVRWLGERRPLGADDLLGKLAEGSDEVAAEATRVLEGR